MEKGIFKWLLFVVLVISAVMLISVHKFLTEGKHGDRVNMTPAHVITVFRLTCLFNSSIGDRYEINMCEECWEGENCFNRTIKTAWEIKRDFFVRENLSENPYEFCPIILKAGLFTLTYDEVVNKKLTNETFEDAYKRVLQDKCRIDLNRNEW